MATATDYLGNVAAAFRALEDVSPCKVELKITNADTNPHRYGVTLWNAFGKWYGSEFTLAASIFAALTRARLDNFGFPATPPGPVDPPRPAFKEFA